MEYVARCAVLRLLGADHALSGILVTIARGEKTTFGKKVCTQHDKLGLRGRVSKGGVLRVNYRSTEIDKGASSSIAPSRWGCFFLSALSSRWSSSLTNVNVLCFGISGLKFTHNRCGCLFGRATSPIHHVEHSISPSHPCALPLVCCGAQRDFSTPKKDTASPATKRRAQSLRLTLRLLSLSPKSVPEGPGTLEADYKWLTRRGSSPPYKWLRAKRASKKKLSTIFREIGDRRQETRYGTKKTRRN